MKKIIKLMFVCVLEISVLVGCNSTKLQLRKDLFIVELGQQISIEVDAYLSKNTDKKVLKNALVKFDQSKAYTIDKEENILKPTNATYLPVGKYKASVIYEKSEEAFVIEVKDTTAPKFIDFKDEVVIEVNAENVDITSYYKVEDLSKANIFIDKGTLDLTKEGTYEIKVIATDKYKNITTKKSIVKIVTLETAEKDGVSETVTGEKPVSKKLQEKLTQVKQQPAEVQSVQPSQNVSSGNAESSETSTPPAQQQQPEKPSCKAGVPYDEDYSNLIASNGIWKNSNDCVKFMDDNELTGTVISVIDQCHNIMGYTMILH